MYTPTGVGGDREATFALSSGVALYAGYAGCGAVQPDERDVATHVTVLSGDLARDDGINGSELWAFNAEHAEPGAIPTVSEWGLVVMTLLLLAGWYTAEATPAGSGLADFFFDRAVLSRVS